MPVPQPLLLNLGEAAAYVAERCAIGIDEAERALVGAFREASLSLYSNRRRVELREKDEIEFPDSILKNRHAGYEIRVQVYKRHIDEWLGSAEWNPPGTEAPPAAHAQHPQAPDWGFWLHVPDVLVMEAVSLSLDIDPKTLSMRQGVDGRYLHGLPEADTKEFARRLDLTNRNLGSTLTVMNWREHRNGADPKIRLQRFAAWAARIWPVPPELAALGKPEPLKPDKPVAVPFQKQWPRAAAHDWLAATYPKGIPAGKSDKVLAREYRNANNDAPMSEHTMRRARTGQ